LTNATEHGQIHFNFIPKRDIKDRKKFGFELCRLKNCEAEMYAHCADIDALAPRAGAEMLFNETK